MKNILNITKTFLENLLLIWQKLMLLSKVKVLDYAINLVNTSFVAIVANSLGNTHKT